MRDDLFQQLAWALQMTHPQDFFRDTSIICCKKVASHEWQEVEGGGGAQVCLIAIVHVGSTGTSGSERPWDRSGHAVCRPMWAEVCHTL